MLTEILTTAFDNAEVWLYISDFYTGEILFANHKFAEFTKNTVEGLLGKKCWGLINLESDSRCPFCPYQHVINSEEKPTGKYVWELHIPSANKWVKVINEIICWIDGRLANIATFYDITEIKLAQAQLTDLAFIDQQLRLMNKLKLTQDMRDASSKPSLIVFDILSLHKINEAYGRDIGDNLLKSVRDWILSLNIPNSSLYRIGGDEFCLSIGQATLETVKEYAMILCHRFAKLWLVEKNIKDIDCLCGAAIGVIPCKYIDENCSLLTMIDITLKVAKSSEKVVVYNEEMTITFKKHIELELSLKRCVNERMTGFDVYYEPIINPVTREWCALEALCRWNSPELGMVSPLMFIPVAERMMLIGVIGLWVLKMAVSKCKEWELDTHKKFTLHVNFSAIQFLDELLAQKIMNVLSDYKYPGNKLCIEITESTQFTFSYEALETINFLRENNVLVALDDFGTGYSNFNNMKNLPVDILKIERAFVANIENDNYQQYIIQVIAALAHNFDMKMIAEGVENEEQLALLQKSGADFLQGYLFSKPLPYREMERQLYNFDRYFDQSD